jgi:hypothetical protein
MTGSVQETTTGPRPMAKVWGVRGVIGLRSGRLHSDGVCPAWPRSRFDDPQCVRRVNASVGSCGRRNDELTTPSKLICAHSSASGCEKQRDVGVFQGVARCAGVVRGFRFGGIG